MRIGGHNPLMAKFPLNGRTLFLTMSALLVCGASTARGSILFLDSFMNGAYEQTGNGNTLALNGYFYSADLNAATANAYTSASLAYPGSGSPVTLAQSTTTDYHYQTSYYPSQAAMDAAFPMGTYTFTGVGGTTDTASYQYTADDYPQSTPYLTGTEYTSLQGMNPSQPFTFNFNPDVTGSKASASYIFFTIYDVTTSTYVVVDDFLSPTTTSVTVAANTLVAGNQYDYEIDFSNRDIVASPGAAADAQLGFDLRTDGLFTTGAAVPEPSTAWLFGVGVAAMIVFRSRRKRCAA